MNYHELLEKYFRAETNLDEEARLRSYILSEEVADDLRQYRPLFQFFEEEKEHSLSEGFEEKLLAEMQQPAKTVRLNSWRGTLLRVAVIVAVLIGAFLLLPVQQHKQQAIDWSKYEVTDEQQAYQETMKALELLAEKLGKGAKTTTKSMAETSKVAKYLN